MIIQSPTHSVKP